MNNNRTGVLAVGALLVAFGVLFLLQNFGFLGAVQNTIWLVLFGAAGLTFLFVFASNRQQWWAVIPGFVLLGLAVLIAFGDRLGAWGGALFLGSIGIGVLGRLHRQARILVGDHSRRHVEHPGGRRGAGRPFGRHGDGRHLLPRASPPPSVWSTS